MTRKKQGKGKPEERPLGGLDLPDGHHCLGGAHFGFEKHGNRFSMAPGITTMHLRLLDEQDALTRFIKGNASFVLEQEKRLATARREFWDVVLQTINVPRALLDTHLIKITPDGVAELSPKPQEQPGDGK